MAMDDRISCMPISTARRSCISVSLVTAIISRWNFRTTFDLADHPDSLTGLFLYANYDDGVVVYVNGTEAIRLSMPAGTITYSTFASSHEGGGYAVRSVRQGSGAERIGIQPGDLLLGINGRRLADRASLRRSALDLRGRSRALVVVQRGGGRYHVTIPLV